MFLILFSELIVLNFITKNIQTNLAAASLLLFLCIIQFRVRFSQNTKRWLFTVVSVSSRRITETTTAPTEEHRSTTVNSAKKHTEIIRVRIEFHVLFVRLNLVFECSRNLKYNFPVMCFCSIDTTNLRIVTTPDDRIKWTTKGAILTISIWRSWIAFIWPIFESI